MFRQPWNYLHRFWMSIMGNSNKGFVASSSVTEEDEVMKLRQGSILSSEVRDRLGLSAIGDNSDPVIIVISHDCDLVKPSTVEPSVELIHGVIRNEPKSGYPYGQSPAMLHIEFLHHQEEKFLELCASNKIAVDKVTLINVDPAQDSALTDNGVEILQGWLAARYKRAAFPDDLNNRLKTMRKSLEGVGNSDPSSILGIWLNYSPKDNHLDSEVPYEVWIKIVYRSQVYGAKDKAEQAAAKLRTAFEKKFFNEDVWNFIDLRECKDVSDDAFTVLDLSNHYQWRLEHISLKQDPPEEYL
jgi:hypothetical protein